MKDVITPEVAQQIAQCLYAGQKIQAIKLYREHSGKELKESKDFVDSLETELRAKEPGKFTSTAGKGCRAMIAVLALAAVAIVAVLAMVFRG